MNRKILGLLAVGTMIGSVAVRAQVTTLTLQEPFSGLVGIEGPPTTAFTGELFASITLDGSIKANDLTLESSSFAVGGYTYVGDTKTSIWAPLTTGPGVSLGNGPGNYIDIQEAGNSGQIDGAFAVINGFKFTGLNGPVTVVSEEDMISIGPYGASIWDEYLNGAPCGTVSAGRAVDPCTLTGMSNSMSTTWTVSTTRTPEIDPGSAASGLTLLLGGLAVLRGRRTHAVRLG